METKEMLSGIAVVIDDALPSVPVEERQANGAEELPGASRRKRAERRRRPDRADRGVVRSQMGTALRQVDGAAKGNIVGESASGSELCAAGLATVGRRRRHATQKYAHGHQEISDESERELGSGIHPDKREPG